MENKDTVVLNEKTISKEEFEEKKKEIEDMSEAKIVEKKKGVFKTRLHD